MSQKFQAAVHHRDDISYIKLSGVIDEDNELADLVDKIPPGTAVIDLGEIERINSCGVRDWVNCRSDVDDRALLRREPARPRGDGRAGRGARRGRPRPLLSLRRLSPAARVPRDPDAPGGRVGRAPSEGAYAATPPTSENPRTTPAD